MAAVPPEGGKMTIGSTEVLSALADRGGYILLERGVPAGHLKGDVITLREAGGGEMTLTGDRGSAFLSVPRVMLDDFLRHSFVELDHAAGDQETQVFRLTREALARFGKHAGRIKIDVATDGGPRFVGSIPAFNEQPPDGVTQLGGIPVKLTRRYGEVWRIQVASEEEARRFPRFTPA